jgi:hypothetical protein
MDDIDRKCSIYYAFLLLQNLVKYACAVKIFKAAQGPFPSLHRREKEEQLIQILHISLAVLPFCNGSSGIR